MSTSRKLPLAGAAALLAALAGLSVARAQTVVPKEIEELRIEQRLGAQVPLELRFREDSGQTVALRQIFEGKPVILVLAYYRCPRLCSQVIQNLVRGLSKIPYEPGKDFHVVVLSFDPRETVHLARANREKAVEMYGRTGSEAGWHFLTGKAERTKQLADAVGFRYRYDADRNLYTHAAGIMVLTPDGKVGRYLLGLDYAPQDLRLALVETGQGKIGSPADNALLLTCMAYDPATGKYTLAAVKLMRAAALLTVVLLGSYLGWTWWRGWRSQRAPEHKSRRAEEKAAGPSSPAPLLPSSPALLFALPAQVQLFPEQASTMAPRVDAVFWFITGVSAFFTVLIAVLIFFFAIRFRRRPGNEIAVQTPSLLRLEVVWTVIPLILVLIMFGWSAAVYVETTTPPDDAMQIYVVGRQWMWHMQHLTGQSENNELHVPAGRPIKLVMTSTDVIHNFSVPDFRLRQDVVPRRDSFLWFTATKPGKYRFLCAEYCGTNHSQMIGWVYVMEPAAFQQWLAKSQVRGALAGKGRQLFLRLQCIACHSGTASARAPLLENIYKKQVALQDGTTVEADEGYLRESILNPQAKVVAGFRPIMPSYEGQITAEEMQQLLAFLKELRAGETPPRLEDTPPPDTIRRDAREYPESDERPQARGKK